MPTHTLEGILFKVFNATDYPSKILTQTQFYVPEKMKRLGTISKPAAHLWNQEKEVEQRIRQICSTTTKTHFSDEVRMELQKLAEHGIILKQLMTQMFIEQFSDVIGRNVFSWLTVLPDWTVAGVYPTDG